MGFIESLQHDPLQLLIPPIAAIVGYVTNVLAVKMMFEPVEFKGVKPYLGWQGIIPANALRLANTGLKLVTARLLDIKDLFIGFDGGKLVERQHEQLRETIRRVVDEKASALFPAMWKAMAPPVKEQVFTMAFKEIEALSAGVLGEAADRIGEILDVQRIVTAAVVEDKTLMNSIFLRVGEKEFQFIERSGLYFGLAFGLVQLVVWIYYPAWWILPFFGFLVGYATNWLAIKMIFDPKKPYKVGPITIQGLFHRRQKAIAKEFSEIMSRRVLNTDNIFQEISTGNSREHLLEIVKRRGDEVFERLKQHPMAKPVLAGAQGEQFEAIEKDVMAEVENEMFRHGGLVYAFADKAEDIRTELHARMEVMEAEAFEDVLRPAFKQDEWKLIIAGAALGLVAGIAQLVFLFGDLVLQ